MASALSSCQNRLPDGIISRGKMTDLLYDYHLAQAMASSSSDSANFKTRLYTAAVFKKYGVSEEQFNKSMEYYCRHAEDLYKMYDKINKRFGENTGGGNNVMAGLALDGDTANVWKGNMGYLLSASADNRMSYSFAADTLLHSGDRLVWNFNSQWIYHDGAKNAVAVIAVEYANDSVATITKSIFTSGAQGVEITIGKVKPRRVSCMLYQVSAFPGKPRYLVVTAPSLIRIRQKKTETPAADKASSDSDSVQSAAKPVSREKAIRDSLLRTDSARHPHFQ